MRFELQALGPHPIAPPTKPTTPTIFAIQNPYILILKFPINSSLLIWGCSPSINKLQVPLIYREANNLKLMACVTDALREKLFRFWDIIPATEFSKGKTNQIVCIIIIIDHRVVKRSILWKLSLLQLNLLSIN